MTLRAVARVRFKELEMNSRRGFFRNLLGAAVAGAITLVGGKASAKKLAFKLEKAPALNKVGGSATIKLAGQEILFVRDTKTSVCAVGSHCTHQDCPLAFNGKTSTIDCSCHGSKFDLKGRVLHGPAKKPLKSYPVALEADRLVITVD